IYFRREVPHNAHPVDFWDRATQSVLCRRATYNHAEYLEQRADMVQKWADYLDELKAHSGILQETAE
ncbi:hypothetical protein ACTHS6_10855, partial [Neisseria sp. P0016.S006]